MTLKVQHKRSAVKGKVPLPTDLEYGEIAVNYEATDPALYVKDSANAVRKIGTPPNATTTVQGAVQLADAAAVTAGTAGRVVDAAQLKAHTHSDATTTTKGFVQLASATDITGGTAGRVVDAAQLKAHTPTDATTAAKGVVQLATNADVTAGTVGHVVDSAQLKAAKYTLPTASATVLGGVKVGTNLAIDATGILSAKVTGALVFKGTKDPTVALPPTPAPATGDVYVMSKAGVIAAGWTGLVGTSVALHELVVWDGTEWVLMGPAVETTVHSVTGTAPITATGTTAVTLTISDATTAAKGVVQLASAADVTAGTAGRVVDAAELKAAKYTLPTATAAALGGVKVGTNLSIDANGILSAKVTGALVFKGAKDPTVVLPAAPAPATGDVYVMNKAGVLAAGWTGLVGTSVSIHELVVFDGTEWVLMGSAVETTVHSITATAPLHTAGTTAVTMRIDDATAAAKGVVQLADAAAITAGTAGRVVDASHAATETAKGIVELATAVETTTGTDATRAVHPAGLKVELDKKVKLSGDTMTGNLTVPSLNGGQLAGFRNILINGNLKINQRGVTIAAAAAGAYGPDRWKKVDAGNMTQIVEDGNFVPGAKYTLSGTGVTTQQLTAPASGNWTLPNIPIAATNIQLELGTVATPYEHRPIGLELMLCQRYYEVVGTGGTCRIFGFDVSLASTELYAFAVEKRAVPTVTLKSGTFGFYGGTTGVASTVNAFLATTKNVSAQLSGSPGIRASCGGFNQIELAASIEL